MADYGFAEADLEDARQETRDNMLSWIRSERLRITEETRGRVTRQARQQVVYLDALAAMEAAIRGGEI